MHPNEDDIIAQGLVLVRTGIIENDWSKICEGYNSISGENLQPPTKPKSRLERIRESIQGQTDETQTIENTAVVDNDNDNTEVTTEELISFDNMTVVDLKEHLASFDIKIDSLKGKKKQDLIKLCKQLAETKKATLEVLVQKQKGGEKFGMGEITVISDPYDPELAIKNMALAAKTLKMPNRKSVVVRDTSGDEDADYRYYDKPKFKPPWR
jgi:hypothetical protein